MEKRIFILTGNPGVGKTTVLRKTVDALKSRGLKVGGMVSREIRKEGIRVGFEIVDIETGETGWLAHVKNKSGPKVGRYRVNLNDIEEIGAKAILNAIEKQDVIALDEIGPMELFSAKFKEASQRALDSQKLVLVVVHQKGQDKIIIDAKTRPDAEVLTVTEENRERLTEVLVEKSTRFLKTT